MAIQKCPHCGARLEVALFDREQYRTNGKGKPGQFESVALGQPPVHYGRLRSLFWFFNRNNQYNPQPIQERLIVRSEYRPSPREMWIKELKLPLTESEVRELADVYIRQGYNWSKPNTVNNTSLGSGKHDNIKDAFLELYFLEDIGQGKKIEYQLTEAGKRFLSYYLDNGPLPPSPLWRYPAENQVPYLVGNSR